MKTWGGCADTDEPNGLIAPVGELQVSSESDHKQNRDKVLWCTCCNCSWETRDELLSDSRLQIVGYQVNFDDLLLGFILFNHLTCQSTLAVPAGLFRDIYDGPVFSQRATGNEECPGYCLRESELNACPAKCECAYVREILQIIRNWPRAENQTRASVT